MADDNSFFLLSKQNVTVDRFHLCTWNVNGAKSTIELGFEFKFPEKVDNIKFILFLPESEKRPTVTCLYDNLKQTENSKFIFNDIVENTVYIGGNVDRGITLKFKQRKNLTLLPKPRDFKNPEGNKIELNFKNPFINSEHENQCYYRMLIEYEDKEIVIIKKGISKEIFIYDIKLNEMRNLHSVISDLLEDGVHVLRINSFFCLHAVPNNYTITYNDSKKMKNIRELEYSAFKKYLGQYVELKRHKYMIMFNKDSCPSGDLAPSYSFFTTFEHERIGLSQIGIALVLNLFCSFLFGISSLRTSVWKTGFDISTLPIEYCIAFILIFIFSIWGLHNYFNNN